MTRLNYLALAVFFTGSIAAAAPACAPDNGGITLPSGFCALVAADGLGPARHIVVAANGDVYVALQSERNGGGGVVALRDNKGDGHFDMKETFGEGSSTGIALRNGYLYVAKMQSVERYKMTPGQLKPAGPAEVVVKRLAWRTPAWRQGHCLRWKRLALRQCRRTLQRVSDQGSAGEVARPGPCPILEAHGGIWKFDENKLGQTQKDGVRFATGLRQMPAITWHDGALYIAMNNRDQLDVLWPGQFTAQENAERPAEPLYRAEQGSNFGWPFCFYDYGQKKFMTNPEYGGDGKTSDRCGAFTPPVAAFPAHWAPVDLMFYTGQEFPKKYQGGAFIAFHGSWNRAPMPQEGYNVTFQPFSNGKPSGNFEVFASGFAGKTPLMNPNDAKARADGVAQAPDGSLYIGDSQKGRMWHVYYRGK